MLLVVQLGIWVCPENRVRFINKGEPQIIPNLAANNMSYRLPIIKIICDITNIIAAVMLNVFSTLGTMLFIPK